ncbi:MAG: AAA family ATPase [Bacteroidetes bacterium]|nr:AAA family ATPase [Bacteroidota bacterium]
MYDRKLKAISLLKHYQSSSSLLCTNNILNLILGKLDKIKIKKKKQTYKSLGYGLNGPQIQAVKSAKENEITIIQGPPGTGKTKLAAAIVNELRLNKFLRGKIYLGAPSNAATDKITNTLYKFILEHGNKLFDIDSNPSKLITRIYSGDKELVNLAKTSLDNSEISLNNKVLFHANENKMNEFLKIHKDYELGKLTLKEEREYKKELDKIRKTVIDDSKIIITTFSTSQMPILKDIKFNYLILDEVTQSTEAEIILPIIKGCEKIVLIGDVNQLGPVKHCTSISDIYYMSFFERILNLTKIKKSNIKPIYLNTQYRMYEKLIEFSNLNFYNDNLETGAINMPNLDLDDFWPNIDNPQFFIDTKEEKENQISTSFVNATEANIIINIYCLKFGLKPPSFRWKMTSVL